MTLTTGVLKDIVCSEQDEMPSDPVVQILGVKRINSQKEGQERIRLVLSDGENYYTSSMLGTQLNDMVKENYIEVKAIIRIKQYTCSIIQETRKIIIILEFDMVKTAERQEVKVGNPVQLSDLIVNHDEMKKSQNKPKPFPNNNNINNKPQTKANHQQQQRFPAAPSASVSSQGKTIFPISSLTPYQNKWTIRVRVTNKSDIRHWSNQKGEGKLFSMDLVDESGEMRATGFNDIVDRYYHMLEKGKAYFITKGTIKTANKKYSSLRNDYELTLNNDSIVEPCIDDNELPDINYNFRKIKDIEQVNKDGFVDIIGVVKSAAEVSQITTKTTNKQVSKRDIVIVDQTASINATLWGTEAENFEENASKNPVIAIKGAKVSDFGGRSLSILGSSVFNLNPDIPEAHEVKGWFDNGGVNKQVTSLSGQRMDGMGGKFKIISQIKDENLGMGEKADYFNLRAFCVFLRKENCMYQACPGAECNKKVIEDGDGYRCEKCDRSYPNFKYRLILSSNIADFSGNQWITSFQDSAEAILGTTAENLGRVQTEDENEFNRIFADASFKLFNFKIRAKMETYQDEKRLKCSAVSAQPVNFRQESRRLLESIKMLEGM